MEEDCQEWGSDEAPWDYYSSVNDYPLYYDPQPSPDPEVKRRRAAFWKRPKTKVYADNFGFGVNRYQCMIDYLDKKDSGHQPDVDNIRLPYLEDRCLRQYSSKKPFRFYDDTDIDKYIAKGERIGSQIRQNDVASPGNVTRRTHTGWSMTKKYVQLVKNSNVIDSRKSLEEGDRSLKPVTVPSVGVRFALESMDPLNLNLMTAHNNLDHAIYMTSRRERLSELDHQLGTAIDQIAEGADDLNRRSKSEIAGRGRKYNLTPYDTAKSLGDLQIITEDLATRNQLRRKGEYEALEDSVDEVLRHDRSKNRVRNNLKALNDDAFEMEDSISKMRRRHKMERGLDDNIPLTVMQSMAKKSARTMLDLHVDDEDVHDADFARLRMRGRHQVMNEPHESTSSRPRHQEVLSDVQANVLRKAKEISGTTSTSANIAHRAKFLNIYVPRHTTADPNCIVQPSRTELNIDHMAKSLATRGKFQRKFDVDEEEDLPASHLNTYAFNMYNKMDGKKPIEVIHSNSLRVRSAVCRARQRNAIAGR